MQFVLTASFWLLFPNTTRIFGWKQGISMEHASPYGGRCALNLQGFDAGRFYSPPHFRSFLRGLFSSVKLKIGLSQHGVPPSF